MSLDHVHRRPANADMLTSIEFSPDGKLLATAGLSKRVGPAFHSRACPAVRC